MVCKYFLLVCSLFFHPLKLVYYTAKFLIWWSPVYFISLLWVMNFVSSIRTLSNPRSWRFVPMFFSKNFIVLCFTLEFNFPNNYKAFQYILHIGLVFIVCGLIVVFCFVLFLTKWFVSSMFIYVHNISLLFYRTCHNIPWFIHDTTNLWLLFFLFQSC